MLKKTACCLQGLLNKTRTLDFTAPLLMRFYLAYIFWIAGIEKLTHISDTAAWFGNPDWGLGLPFPILMAWLAGLTEAGGAISFILGFGVRWFAIPLMGIMIVAATTVHIDNGWLVIASHSSEGAMRLSNYLDKLSRSTPDIYKHLTELGQPVVLNNGIEFAATYFIMLLSLFFVGAGNYLSLDYWFKRYCKKKCREQSGEN